MNATFGAILDKKPGDIERPKNLPPGSYEWIIRGLPKQDKSSKKQTEYVEFTLVPQGPLQGIDGNKDVDQELLDEALTKRNGEKIQIQSKSQRLTFYLTDDALFRLEDFLRHTGLDIPTEAQKREMSKDELDALPSLRQSIAETPNRSVGGHITHKPSEDGQRMYANITSTFALES